MNELINFWNTFTSETISVSPFSLVLYFSGAVLIAWGWLYYYGMYRIERNLNKDILNTARLLGEYGEMMTVGYFSAVKQLGLHGYSAEALSNLFNEAKAEYESLKQDMKNQS